MSAGLEIFGIEGIGEVRPRDDLAGLIATAAADHPGGLRDGDVLVVTQKVVSKAEGKLVAVDPDDPRSHKALVEAESVASCAAAATSSSPRPSTASCAPTPASTSRTSSSATPRPARRQRPVGPAHPRRHPGAGGGGGGGHRQRHVRAHVAARPDGRRHRLRRDRGDPRPPGHHRHAGPRAPGHRGRGGRRAGRRRRPGAGQGLGAARGRDPRVDRSWFRAGSVRDEIVRDPAEDLFR
ncbi:MAG: coenzyme F420-0:L-glutamate ligase [Acidimicrobiales bacterium]